MKSSSHRIILIALLVIASFCSYSYLNLVSIEDAVSPTASKEQVIPQEETDKENQEIYLPDVEIIKKAIETGKKALSIAAGLNR